MKFTPCFVRVEDVEERTKLLRWMFAIEYAGRYRIDKTNSIVAAGLDDGCADVVSCNTSVGLVSYGLIYCGENIELFKAMVAMNDENDLDQWFIDESGRFEKCSFKKANIVGWIMLYGKTPRKATVAEIIEHFKRQRNNGHATDSR